MRLADELADPKPLGFPASSGIRKAELDMAKALVNSLAAEWDPEKYTDQYLENLMRIIKGKAKGKKVTLEAPDTPRQGEVVDLMERLRRSLDQAGAKSKPAKPRAVKKKKRAAKCCPPCFRVAGPRARSTTIRSWSTNQNRRHPRHRGDRAEGRSTVLRLGSDRTRQFRNYATAGKWARAESSLILDGRIIAGEQPAGTSRAGTIIGRRRRWRADSADCVRHHEAAYRHATVRSGERRAVLEDIREDGSRVPNRRSVRGDGRGGRRRWSKAGKD